jgi:hypothetical protein
MNSSSGFDRFEGCTGIDNPNPAYHRHSAGY